MRVFVHEHLLDRDSVGAEGFDDRVQFRVEQQQPVRQRQFRVCRDLAIVDVAQPVAFLADDAPAGGAKAGVKPKNYHPSFAITSSDTS